MRKRAYLASSGSMYRYMGLQSGGGYMVEWYWLIVAAWIGGAVGLLVSSLCLVARIGD